MPVPAAATSDVFGSLCLGAAQTSTSGSAVAAVMRPSAAPLLLGSEAVVAADDRLSRKEYTKVGTVFRSKATFSFVLALL